MRFILTLTIAFGIMGVGASTQSPRGNLRVHCAQEGQSDFIQVPLEAFSSEEIKHWEKISHQAYPAVGEIQEVEVSFDKQGRQICHVATVWHGKGLSPLLPFTIRIVWPYALNPEQTKRFVQKAIAQKKKRNR